MYIVWAIFAWLTITYASLVYRMLDASAEQDLVNTWLVSFGLNQLTDLRDGAIALAEILLLATVLEVLWLVPNSRWIEARLDFLSILAASAGSVWGGKASLYPPPESRRWRRAALAVRRTWVRARAHITHGHAIF
jgi:hypothetical protein